MEKILQIVINNIQYKISVFKYLEWYLCGIINVK